MSKVSGVAQFFYHFREKKLPIRDIGNTNGMGNKTEPHYENFTENWCNQCMNKRIASANQHSVDYLFLITRYHRKGHKYNNTIIVVGYLKRASTHRFIELSATMRSKAGPFDPNRPEGCGFFAGDPKSSKFVSADDAYPIKGLKNPRWLWLMEKELVDDILKHFKNKQNIVKELQKQAVIETKGIEKNENYNASCRNR